MKTPLLLAVAAILTMTLSVSSFAGGGQSKSSAPRDTEMVVSTERVEGIFLRLASVSSKQIPNHEMVRFFGDVLKAGFQIELSAQNKASVLTVRGPQTADGKNCGMAVFFKVRSYVTSCGCNHQVFEDQTLTGPASMNAECLKNIPQFKGTSEEFSNSVKNHFMGDYKVDKMNGKTTFSKKVGPAAEVKLEF